MSDSLQPHGLVACQVPLSMEFSRQEYVGVSSHLLLQGTFPTQASNLNLLHLRWIFFLLCMPPGKPLLSQRSSEAHCLENAYTNAIFFTVKHCQHLRNGQIFLRQSVCNDSSVPRSWGNVGERPVWWSAGCFDSSEFQPESPGLPYIPLDQRH